MPYTTTITLELDCALNDSEKASLRSVLNDALGEYIGAREAFENYVANRYPDMSASWCAEKVRQVRQRVIVAAAIRRASITCGRTDG